VRARGNFLLAGYQSWQEEPGKDVTHVPQSQDAGATKTPGYLQHKPNKSGASQSDIELPQHSPLWGLHHSTEFILYVVKAQNPIKEN
jgi:hypothetical protein